MSNHINLHKFMFSYETKMIKNSNNLFKQQFLIHPDEIFCKISIVVSSY
jgi:site-specific recombinase XerC